MVCEFHVLYLKYLDNMPLILIYYFMAYDNKQSEFYN